MRTSRRGAMKRGIAVLMWFAAFAPQAHAGAIPELVDQLRQGMDWAQGAMDTGEACTVEDAWYFRRFWLRLRPKATISIPGVKLTLVPEVEVLLERDLPDGWVAYKP
jgi:hypothetical protein